MPTSQLPLSKTFNCKNKKRCDLQSDGLYCTHGIFLGFIDKIFKFVFNKSFHGRQTDTGNTVPNLSRSSLSDSFY